LDCPGEPRQGRSAQTLASEIAMRLTYIDRIVELQPGARITAIKNLSLTEDYLRDHFPSFPVMPGVLMLEAMYQTAAWLARVTDDFRHSLVTLAEANNVKYSGFIEPGQTLRVRAELVKRDERTYQFKCEGDVEDKSAVRGRLVLRLANLSEQDPQRQPVDEYMVAALRQKLRLLGIQTPPPGEPVPPGNIEPDSKATISPLTNQPTVSKIESKLNQ
jgi:3-hydroxyacyl-[acyl-carrier-protein] dehydratase